MNAQELIFVLSESMLYSLMQSAALYTFTLALLKGYPSASPAQRFNLLYGTQILILIGFFGSLLINYISITDEVTGGVPVFNSGKELPSVLSTVTLPAGFRFWISAAYMTGLVMQLIYLGCGAYRMNCITSEAMTIADRSWNKRLRKLAARIQLPSVPELKITAIVDSPFTTGVLKPIIVVPAALFTRLSVEQVEAILLHELAHLKRNDFLLNIILKVMEAILVFNPFAWIIAKQINKERELCCDDIVSAELNPVIYSEALTIVAQFSLFTKPLNISASGNSESYLLTRIKRITMKKASKTPDPKLFIISGLIAAGFSVAWIVPQQQDNLSGTVKPLTEQAFSTDTVKIPKTPPLPALPPAPGAPPAPALPPAPPAVSAAEPPLPPVPEAPAPPALPDTNGVRKAGKADRLSGDAEFQKSMLAMKLSVAEIQKQFDSPEWKDQMARIKSEAEQMKKHFDSPEWTAQMEQLKQNADELRLKFNSPEWKEQIEKLKAQAEELSAKAPRQH